MIVIRLAFRLAVAATLTLINIDLSLAQTANTTLVPVGLPPNISCADAKARLQNNQFANDDDKLILSVRDTGCQAQAYNERHQSDPPGDKKVVYVTPDPQSPKNVLFGVMTLNEAKGANKLCKILTGGFAAKVVGDPQLGALVGALGTFRCDQYFDLAVKSDPLLIVFPTLAPEARLTVDALRAGREAAVRLVDNFKAHPADLATIAINPTAQGRLLQSIGESVGGTGGQIIKNGAKAMRDLGTKLGL